MHFRRYLFSTNTFNLFVYVDFDQKLFKSPIYTWHASDAICLKFKNINTKTIVLIFTTIYNMLFFYRPKLYNIYSFGPLEAFYYRSYTDYEWNSLETPDLYIYTRPRIRIDDNPSPWPGPRAFSPWTCDLSVVTCDYCDIVFSTSRTYIRAASECGRHADKSRALRHDRDLGSGI